MSNYTPGPWTYHATAGNHDFAIYPEATGRDIALVRDFDEPNARLMAAAPDMAEALRFAITENGAVAERSHIHALKRLEAITEAVRAALAKAGVS